MGGYTNYHSNSGTWAQLKGWDGVFGAVTVEEGIPALPPLRLAKIIDGTSKTVALAEMINGTGIDEDDLAGDPQLDCFNFGGMPVPVGGGSLTLQKLRTLFLIRRLVDRESHLGWRMADKERTSVGRRVDVADLVQPLAATKFSLLGNGHFVEAGVAGQQLSQGCGERRDGRRQRTYCGLGY